MDDVTQENQQKVRQYMAATNEKDLVTAIATMKNHEFNLQLAIKHKEDGTSHPTSNRSAPHQPTNEQIVTKYIEFGEKKGAESNAARVLFDLFSQLVVNFFRYLGSFLPTFIYILLFGTPFQKLYRSSTNNKYTHRPLKYYLPKTKNINVKSILLLISPRQRHPDVTAFLNDCAIQQKIKEHYFMCCYLVGNKEISTIQGSEESPQVIVLRWNIFQQLVEAGREKDITKVTIDQLAIWWHQGRNLYRRDGNVLVKCQNFITKESGVAMEGYEEPEVRLIQRKPKRKDKTQQNQNRSEEHAISNVEQQEGKLLRRKEQERKNQASIAEQSI